MVLNWWRRLLSPTIRTVRRERRPAPPGRRRGRSPALEPLEERCLLANASPPYMVFQPGGAKPAQSASPIGYTPDQIRTAYGINQIQFGGIVGDGTGQTIAIIDAGDNPAFVNSNDPAFASSDLHQFDLAFNLPDPPNFTKVGQDGGPPPTGAVGNFTGEIALDVEWAHALAPGANILLVEANSASLDDLLTAAVPFAASQPGVSVVSMSFGTVGGEPPGETAFDPLFVTPSGHNGVTFLASTGDNAAPGGYPAFSPNVVAVGGTTLTINADNTYLNETAWSKQTVGNATIGGGGGISTQEPQPSYQMGVVTQSTTNRTTPDVSFDANPDTGVAVYDSTDNGATTPWAQIGGTSFACPAWGSLVAIADQLRVAAGLGTLDGPSETLPTLYGLFSLAPCDYHDITQGNNGFPAGPGYDLATGLGSPVANLIVPDLVRGLTPTLNFTASPSTGPNNLVLRRDGGNVDLFVNGQQVECRALNKITGINIVGAPGTTNTLSVQIGTGGDTWNITGLNSGTVDGLVTFSGIQNLSGGPGNDLFVVSPGAGLTGTADGGGGSNTVSATQDASFTLSNSLLTTTAGTSLGLANIQVANLTGGPGSNNFDVSGWTGTGTLNGGGGGSDAVLATKDANFTLANNSLTSSDGMIMGLVGIRTANLAGGPGDNLFDVSGWTGAGTLTGGGGNDTVAAAKDGNFILDDNFLTTSDGMSLGLSAIKIANLTGGLGNNNFDVGGWTGLGTLNGGGGIDTVSATKNVSFALGDTFLAATDGMALGLGGIHIANLTGGPGTNVFEVSTWTGTGTLNGGGGGLDEVTATKEGNFLLTDSALNTTDGMSLALNGILVAGLRAGPAGNHLFDVSGWTGQGGLFGLGGGPDTVVATKDFNFSLGDSFLITSDGMGLTLGGVAAAALTGGTGNNTFEVSTWTGLADLDGGGGNNSYLVILSGVGFGTTSINNTGSTGSNNLVVQGAQGPNAFTITNNSMATTGGESVNYSGIQNRAVVGGPSNDIFNVLVTEIPPSTLAVDGGAGLNVLGVTDITGGAVIHVFSIGPGSGIASVLYLNGPTSTVTFENIASVATNPDQNQSFIQELYHKFTGRSATPDEVAFWLNVLQTTGSQVAVARGILTLPEVVAPLVDSWFPTYLGRNPLPGEDLPWIALFQQGFSEEQILGSFLNQTEYFARAGFQDDVFIQVLFTQLLGRSATPSEVFYWDNTLRSQVGRGGTAWLLLNTPEYRLPAIEVQFNRVLGRSATPQELMQALFSGLDVLTIAAVLASTPEFFLSNA